MPPSSLYPSHRFDFHLIRYHTASQIKKRQDEYCARAITEDWVGLGDFPEVLEWESLVDVLRGRVKVILTNRFAGKNLTNFSKVHVHVNEAVDLDAIVRVRLLTLRRLTAEITSFCQT